MKKFGLIVIGDEILSGQRQDQHVEQVRRLLQARGLGLGWVQILGDDRAHITAVLRQTLAGQLPVFCCGGIGATPDDHTRQAAAAALGVPLVLHEQAKHNIQERLRDIAHEKGESSVDWNHPDNLQRLKMGEFPIGASIIPNPFNKIPGFCIAQPHQPHQPQYAAHYFVPGFPVMAHPMLAWVLDTHYTQDFHQTPEHSRALKVYGEMESSLTPLMEKIEADFVGVKVFSLPTITPGERRFIELGVKGEPAAVEQAFLVLQQALQVRAAEVVTL